MDYQRTALSIGDVAKILQVSEKTVTRMLHDGAIPGFKVANQWRFHPDDFERWLDSKRRVTGDSGGIGTAALSGRALEPMPLSRLTAEDLIIPNLSGGSKRAVLSSLVDPLMARGVVEDKETFLEGLLARERMVTTGIGGRLALPHLRNPEVQPVERPLMVVGISKTGIDWASIDNVPVNLFMMPVTGSEVLHVRILSEIRRSLIVDDLVDKIIAAGSQAEVLSILLMIETLQMRVLQAPDFE